MLYALGSALFSLSRSVFSLQGIKHVLHEPDENEYLLNVVRIYLFIQKIHSSNNILYGDMRKTHGSLLCQYKVYLFV